jgi:hypothetical protein
VVPTMSDKSDEEIRQIILKRFPRTFELGPAGDEIVEHEETRGRKSAFWHQLAIEYVKTHESDFTSRNEVCKRFQKRLAAEFGHNVSPKTVRDVVRSHYGRPYKNIANKKFVFAVLQNDLDQAVYWFRHLSPKERKRWGFE